MNDAGNKCSNEVQEVGLRERLENTRRYLADQLAHERLENTRRYLADQLAHVQLALDELAADPTLERKIEIVRRAGTGR